MDETHEVRFDLTPRVMMLTCDTKHFARDPDYLELYVEWFKETRQELVSRHMLEVLLIPIAAVGVVYMLFQSDGEPVPLAVALVGLAVGGVITAALAVHSRRAKTVRSLLDRRLAEQAGRNCVMGLLGPVRIKLDENGVTYQDGGTQTHHRWPAFRRVFEGEQADMLVTYGQRVLVIPHSAHGEPEDRAEFLEYVRRMDSRHGGSKAVATRYLMDHDLKCLGCGYGLRGCAGICPECARVVDAELPVPRW